MENLNKVKKFAAVALASFSLIATAEVDYNTVNNIKVNKTHTTFLDDYRQLNNYNGRDGLYFVRNAAGTKTYNTYGIVTGTQGGDPTVQQGWAVYVWDRYKDKTPGGAYVGGWTKLAEEETLDANVYEQLLYKYVPMWTFTNFVAEVRNGFETKAEHNTHISIINNTLTNHRSKIANAENRLNTAESDISTIDGKADRNRDDIIVINQKLDSMQLDEVRRTLIDATNRVTVAEKTISDTVEVVEDATNTVARMESSVASNTVAIGELGYNHNVNSQRIDGVEATIVTKEQEYLAGLQEAISNLTHSIELATADAKLHSDTNDAVTAAATKSYADTVGVNAVAQAESIADTKKAEAVTAAASDATSKANVAETAAKGYTDTTATSIRNDIVAATNDAIAIASADATAKDATNLQAAKDYTDAAVAAATDRAYVDAQDAAVSNNVIAIAAADATEKANKSYADATNYVETTASNCVAIVSDIADQKETELRQADTDNLNTAKQYTDDEIAKLGTGALKYIDVTDSHVLIGPYAENTNNTVSINLNPFWKWPSYTHGDFNINLGIDNEVGFGTGSTEGYNARYSVVIGTSSSAKMMHDYAFGSQIHAHGGNTTVIGYGGTSTDPYSTVIGHGRRPLGGGSSPDKAFDTEEDMRVWLAVNNASTWFKGYHFGYDTGRITSSNEKVYHTYTITKTLTETNSLGEYAEYAEIGDSDTVEDIEGGQYDWRYGKSHGHGTFNIVTWNNAYKASQGLASVYINDDRMSDLTGVHLGEIVTKTNWINGSPVVKANINDYSLTIGQNARVDGNSGTHTQSIALGRDAHSAAAASCALGPNSEVYGQYGIAVGWRAAAVGDHSIAIGAGKQSGQNYWTDDTHSEHNPNERLALAEGANSISIGYGARALGSGSVQLGEGSNSEANTLKFQDVTIVKNGKINGFDESALDPKTIDVTEHIDDDVEGILAFPHVVNTLTSTTNLGPGTELYVGPKSSRNYEVYIPNEEEFIHGLPIGVDSDLPDGIKMVFVGNKKWSSKLPILVKIQQPTAKTVLCTMTELDDGTDWTPVVTNSFIRFDGVAGRFRCINRKKSIEGTSLHHATEFKIAYPTTSGVATNDFKLASPKDGLISGTYYNYAAASDFTPESPISIDDSAEIKTWYEIIYKTVNGTANVFHVDLTSIIDIVIMDDNEDSPVSVADPIDGLTRVKYTPESGLPDWEGNIEGTLGWDAEDSYSRIPNHYDAQEIRIGTNITSIGDAALNCSTNLVYLYIPNSVTTIGNSAFGSSSIGSITIPDSVTTIRAWAFANCTNLTSMTIPSSVTLMEGQVFTGCNSLTNVYFKGRTMDQVRAMNYYRTWGLEHIDGCSITSEY